MVLTATYGELHPGSSQVPICLRNLSAHPIVIPVILVVGLNNQTVKDAYLLACIKETLDSLQGSQWFSSLDLKSGYWPVKMDKKNKLLTTFTVGPLGFYKCDRMPFGLTNAPATFQQLMETCLRDLKLSWCIIYLDDILIFFSKDLASHLKWLEVMFQGLEQAGLKLNPSKCELFHRQIMYLGHIVSAQGIVTNEPKIDAIRKWSTPTTITEVQSFLGFVGYYCQFIPKFAQVAQPKHELMSGKNADKKKVTITRNDKFQQSFGDLKCLCTTASILACANFTKPFKLYTNASRSSLGAVLYQTHDDGTDAVITYTSRSLTKTETHYPTHKLEFLTLKWAMVEKFHKYLYGLTFDIYTNNNPLMYVLMTAKLDATSH